MTDEMFGFITLYLFTHIWVALKGHSLIRNSNFDNRKKRLNKIIMWFIPFIWYLVFKSVVQRVPGSYEIPNKSDSGPFYENGFGAPGAGIKDH
jgi:hypothetical protein